ncbi:YkyA family protein [Caldibacillus lycopersici]|uniref:YkyA family protein n=1 Tax=Perspicuibacillus lycopersici TaxID=1325689 RepID=A0AAE3IQC0_9BACI|nr:YkyA family protein [Perspicuibacillus lycopersici]MCU9612257.1 YkyA family protein [Perspicuibacillus lycopersici]
MRKQKVLLVLIIGLLFLLSGCFNRQSTEEKIYEALESVVQLEQEFENQQEPLMEIEKQEKEVYDSILELGLKEHDQIVTLADEAIGLTEKRQELLDKENDSIEQAKKEFENVQKLIEKIEDEKLHTEAQNLYDTMMKRYSLHEQLYEQYALGIQYDQELYNMFKQEDVLLDVLQPQIEKINAAYAKVYELNDQFNEQTERYNDSKVQFYENAGLNIQLEENDK